mmetsp:Transcript_120103/g.346981  ORF Transcript_120103/g.346981 Transcript_120103/m.346981 type:complete len:221 (+) Transcript_120103:88-750(+)
MVFSICCSSRGGGDDVPSEVKAERVVDTLKNIEYETMPEVVDASQPEERADDDDAGSWDNNDKYYDAKQAVQDFLRTATEGRRITVLKENADGDTVDRIGATFRFHHGHSVHIQGHGHFSIIAGGDTIWVSIAGITDIFTVARDGASVFPKSLVTRLTDEELPRLFKVYYKHSEGATRCLVMLESKAESVDHFMLSVSLLKQRASHMGATHSRVSHISSS